MVHFCFTTTVLEGKLEGYLNYHDNIWPEVHYSFIIFFF